MDICKLIWAFFLLCFSTTVVTSSFPKSESLPENGREDSDIYSNSNPDGPYNTGLTLDDIFEYKVDDTTELCPKKYMMLFLITRDVQYLKQCGYDLGVSKTKTAKDGPKTLVASYSGNILKRILDNMDGGTAKIDFQEDVKGDSEKRARLSINGALSSLVEMLRHESRRHRRPQYAFHREMLNMG